VSARHASGAGVCLSARTFRLAGAQVERVARAAARTASIEGGRTDVDSAARRERRTDLARKRLSACGTSFRRIAAARAAPVFARAADRTHADRDVSGNTDAPRSLALAHPLHADAGHCTHCIAHASDEKPVGQPGCARSRHAGPRTGIGTARCAALRAGARAVSPEGAQPFETLLGLGREALSRLPDPTRLATRTRGGAEGGNGTPARSGVNRSLLLVCCRLESRGRKPLRSNGFGVVGVRDV